MPGFVDALLAAASFVAGFQNALAGGGSFLTLPALLLTGLDSRAANIASTIALFPAQVATGFVGRQHAGGTHSLKLSSLFIVSLIGGAVGAIVLLGTPPQIFASLLPWLVLFTTLVFAWGSFFRRADSTRKRLAPADAGVMQFAISVYGGYFGGGIGILMLAVLTLAGLTLRNSAATKNILAAVINSSAVAIFAFSRDVAWKQVAVVAVAAIAGGQLGAYVLNRVNEQAMRICIVLMGVALTIGLFVRYHST
ncbi:MAG TPA: sulfite exporter TauE/SafE family protein [Steroidobacteraceae bacterium]|nr:sulfite exporter TauE/SafE family protein [Steroidobacteraceae bacterium]